LEDITKGTNFDFFTIANRSRQTVLVVEGGRKRGGHSLAGQPHHLQAGHGEVFYDPDGTGPPGRTLFAKVDPGTNLIASDFIVIA